MNYNIHPIVVHFPIVLLCIYSLIKIIPVKKWFPRVAWGDIELLVLLFGVLGAFAALSTGETAEHLTRPNRQLVSVHSNAATMATFLYAVLLVGELTAMVNTHYASLFANYPFVKRFLLIVDRILAKRMIAMLIAFAALAAITLTGLLGGVLVYGTSADPFAAMILKLLGLE